MTSPSRFAASAGEAARRSAKMQGTMNPRRIPRPSREPIATPNPPSPFDRPKAMRSDRRRQEEGSCEQKPQAYADQGGGPHQIEIDPAAPQEIEPHPFIHDECDNSGDDEHGKAVHEHGKG